MIEKLESMEARRQEEFCSRLGRGRPQRFMSQYGPCSILAAGTSTGRSDVSSLGSTRWSSRISCMSGSWSPAGTKKTKALRKVTRSPLPNAPIRRGGRVMSYCSARESSRWTIGNRSGLRNCRRPRERRRCLRTAWNRGDPYFFHSWFHGRRACIFKFRRNKSPERERDGKTPGAKPGRGSSSTSSIPNRVSGQLALAWEDLLASPLLSRLVGMRPFRRRAVQAPRFLCWVLLLGSRSAQCFSRLAFCLDLAQGVATSVPVANQSAQPYQKPTTRPQALDPARFGTRQERRCVFAGRRSAQLQQWRQ